MIKEYYCPSCGFECAVKHLGTDFDSCECQSCGGIMLLSKTKKGLYKGIINNDCGDSSAYYRNELLKLGFPKSTLKFGILKRKSDNADHVILIIDVTKQINKAQWEIEKIKG